MPPTEAEWCGLALAYSLVPSEDQLMCACCINDIITVDQKPKHPGKVNHHAAFSVRVCPDSSSQHPFTFPIDTWFQQNKTICNTKLDISMKGIGFVVLSSEHII